MTSKTREELKRYCEEKNFNDDHPHWKHFYLTHDVIRIFENMAGNLFLTPRFPIHYGD
jgi:hypothetical protein